MSLNNIEIAEIENAIRNLVKIRNKALELATRKSCLTMLDLTQNALDVLQRLLPDGNRFKYTSKCDRTMASRFFGETKD